MIDFNTLKAWIHWVQKNPMSEDQLMHANATNDLFSLLGARDAEIQKLRADLAVAREALISIAQQWSHMDVNNKYWISSEAKGRAALALQRLSESDKETK